MPRKKPGPKTATVVGVFATRSGAEAALRDLRAARFKGDRLGLVARNATGRLVAERDGTYADEGAVAGLVAGAGVGTLIGLGVLAGVIPVVGPAVVVGTLGTILANAVGGAAALGLAGALVGWGIPEDDAKFYEGEVKAGRFLVTVDAGGRAAEARAVLVRHGASDEAPAVARAGRTAKSSGGAAKTPRPKKEPAKANKRPAQKGKVPARKRKAADARAVADPAREEKLRVAETANVEVKGAATTRRRG